MENVDNSMSYPHFPHRLDNYKEAYSSACSYPHYQQYDDDDY